MNIENYKKAWKFAAKAHKNQKYYTEVEGETTNYLTHIGDVAMETMWVLQNSQQTFNADLALSCAILHDTIEDTETSLDDIKKEFGQQVAAGVSALTKDETLSKPKQMQDSLTRIKKEPKEIWVVKMADRSSNLAPPPPYWNSEKIEAYKKEALQIYSALSEADQIAAERLKARIENYPYNQY